MFDTCHIYKVQQLSSADDVYQSSADDVHQGQLLNFPMTKGNSINIIIPIDYFFFSVSWL